MGGLITFGLVGDAVLAIRGGILVTEEGLDIVTSHLAQFGDWAPNQAMIDRLVAQVGSRVTGADANFYTHEMLEAEYMSSGMSYDAAHAAALEQAGVSPYSIYHADVVKQYPSLFNSNWRAYWGLGGYSDEALIRAIALPASKCVAG